jgi:nucleotide-binding universal stress UspA family protein
MELAKALNAKIILANAYQQMPIPITDPVVVVPPDDMYSFGREQLEMEAELLGIDKCVPFETVCGKGPSSATILNMSKKMNAVMILLGIKKSDNGLRKFLGSTATELARRTTVAMIAIPTHIHCCKDGYIRAIPNQ